jgi:thiamine-monophosphate kinase
MAAMPIGLVSALAIPRDWRGQLSEIAEGIGEAAEEFATPIVGGNVTGGALLTITITVLGSVERALPRSGVQPGDTLYVTGELGASGAALRALEKGDTPIPAHRSRFARPRPRIKEARWLAANGARAAIDVSDGLLAELTHLAAASGVRIQLKPEGIPLAQGVSLADALQSGEEYELLVAGPSLDSARFARELGVPLAPVAVARALAAGERPGVDSARAARDARVAPARGHDHFSS